MKKFIYNNLKIIILIGIFVGILTVKSNADTQHVSKTINLCGTDVEVEYQINTRDDGSSYIISFSCKEPEKLNGELVIPKEINGIRVDSLGNDAFKNATGLTGVVVPSTLDSGGYKPFQGCINLKSIKFDADVIEVPSFIMYDCDGIEEVVLPDHIRELGSYCFADCDNLKSITLSKNLASIGCCNFEYCPKLTSVHIPKSLGNTNTSDAQDNFRGCTNLKVFTFEEGITRIPSFLFYGCNSIEEIKLPDTIVEIDSYAFEGCSSLKEIELPKTVEKIGIEVFDNCTSLEKITIYDNVKRMGMINDISDCNGWIKDWENMFSNHNPNLTIYCYKDSFADKYAQMLGINVSYMTKTSPTPTGELNVQNYVRNNTGNNIVINVSTNNQIVNRANNVAVNNKLVDNRIVAADVNNRTDNTVSNSILPYTGHNAVALLLGALLLVIIPMLYLKLSKYKEV